ncbi:MAG: DUF1573 domain-containing protein [Acidobacteria bacterium]|nr:DUF1573 domain-containing protein [Acidobacteriota bacterium]
MADDRPLDSRRELENLRQRYHEHRRSVRHLLQTAPDERLATRYEATLTELQKSIDQLDRIDRDSPAESERAPFDPNQTRSIKPGAAPAAIDTLSTRPGAPFDDVGIDTKNRGWNHPVVKDETVQPEQPGHAGERKGPVLAWIAGIIVLIVLVLAAIMYWPEGGEDADAATATLVEENSVEEPPAPPSALSVEPASYDYGIIRKGTRSVHRFTMRNRTDQVLPISISRSECRCLWYDHPPEIPAGESAEVAITVDGARADTGVLTESVIVTSEAEPDARAEIDLTAQIREQ